MNSGVLSLNTRRNVSFAAAEAGPAFDAAETVVFTKWDAVPETKLAGAQKQNKKKQIAVSVIRTAALKSIPLIARLDANHANRRFTPISPARPLASRHPNRRRTRSNRSSPARRHRNPKSHPRLIRLNVAERHRQCVRGIRWLRHLAQRQQRPHHQLNLPLIRMPITRHRRLHLARRITVHLTPFCAAASSTTPRTSASRSAVRTFSALKIDSTATTLGSNF